MVGTFHRRPHVNRRTKIEEEEEEKIKEKREKKGSAHAKETTNFRRVHPFLLRSVVYWPHFRGQETGPAITHSCICHELNLEIVRTYCSPISFLEQQVSLMNDYWKKASREGLHKRNNGSEGTYRKKATSTFSLFVVVFLFRFVFIHAGGRTSKT